MQEEIRDYQLENGLRVLLKEIHTTPIISQWIWYRVGSRNEVAGITGISHWVEHLQFKGTEKFPIDKLDHAISRVGGYWNALTYLDWTSYFETLPAKAVDISLDLEADRMINSKFDKKEIEMERTVVISELEGHENEPLFLLNSKMQNEAFEMHPYKNDVIGNLEDLKQISRDQLFHHYKTYYSPNNAILCMAGDFDSSEMTQKIDQYFGNIPSSKLTTNEIKPQVELQPNKEFEIHNPGDAIYVKIAYQAPEADNPNFFTLSVIDSLLAGPSPLVMFGGGNISNRTSRLYQALIEKDLAVSISGGIQATIDPYLYSITLTIQPDKDPHQAINALDNELQKLVAHQINQYELDRAVHQAEAMFAYGSESITNEAFWMGYANIFADYSWYLNYIQHIKSVTTREIQQLSKKYFEESNRVVGIYYPVNEDK